MKTISDPHKKLQCPSDVMLLYMIIILLFPKTYGSETEESLKQYVSIYKTRILQNYSRCNLFFRASSEVSKDLVNWFSREIDCPNIIITKIFDFRFIVSDGQADFHFFESVDHVQDCISKLPKTFFCNGKADAHFIISTKVKNLDFLLPTFEFLWQKHFVNCVIVFVYKKLEIFSYDAFRKITLNLTECGRCPLFSPYRNNFWGYPLRISLFEEKPLLIKCHNKWLGRDYRIMKNLVKKLNVSVEIIETPHYFSGASESLINNKSDICLVSMFLLHQYNNEDVECSYPDHFNNLVAMVPSGVKIPQYQNLFYTFDLSIWIYLIVTMLGVAFISKIMSFGSHNQTYWYYLLNVWRSFLQQGIWNFAHTYGKAKAIMVLWFCFCLIFGTAFQTSLISVFIKSKYFKNINTFSELRDSGMKLHVIRPHVEVIPKEYGLHRQFKIVKNMKQLDRIVLKSNTDCGYILTENAARFYIEFIRKRDNKPMYHIVAEKLVPGLEAYMFQKKSPFIGRVNDLLLLLKEFGLGNYRMTRVPVISKNFGKSNIGILNLQGALYLLVLGYILSVVCFIAELLINIMKK